MGAVLDAYDETVESLDAQDVDSAVVALGRALASQIDAAEFMEGEARTKALYLTPHLMNVLKELLATPASRKAVAGVAKGAAPGGKLGQLQSITGGRPA